jgi:hypothetical protein
MEELANASKDKDAQVALAEQAVVHAQVTP